MSISVKAVSKHYDVQKALDEVSIEVKPGEIVGFLGPNGAGKSTLMKIITGYIPPSSGQVSVCGFDVENEPLNVKRKIGYLPELNPVYPDLYVKEYLLFTAGVYGIKNKKEKVAEMIRRVGLEVEQKKKIGELSKGYKQRVGLAQALIHDPEVLILDEPTTGLDPNQISDIRLLIKSLGKEKTVMLSTHIMQEVEAICDRVIIINKGRIVANEVVDNLKKLSNEKSTVLVEFDHEVVQKELEKISGVKKAIKQGGNTWKIEGNKDIDVRNSLNSFANTKGLSILSLSLQESSLESVFKQLTNPG